MMQTMTRGHESSAATGDLLVAFELSQRWWKVGFTTGMGHRVRTRRIAAGALEPLAQTIADAKKMFGLAAEARVISCDEAGRDGFWLHRYLTGRRDTNYVAAQDGPAILVGHSYGGVVITEAGNDPKVAGLVYIAAFAPHKGESVSALIQNPPLGAPVPPILPPQDGFLFLDRAQFRASFATDVSADAAAFMADSQVPWGLEALNGTRKRTGMEVEAKLVSRVDGGQNDSA